ncbi:MULTISPECIES: penicillin-binding protein activator [unclassified Acinetobacter]|uniref:penicillin-binding protein activator n=1 Tax=unclassified Acinetobacter TaxID=196816 RepID=UPI0015D2628E|nr:MULTISPECIES: penicillin-binding protein activator [unclassified Acinetobacter]
MLDNKNKILGLCLLSSLFTAAQADVLVILPESGPMARAASSIKQGFNSAYQSSDYKVPIKFVDSNQKQIAAILKQQVNKKTQLVIGPLARQDVEALVKAKPKVRVLALNETTSQIPNVWQYSLSKRDDALALQKVFEKDKLAQVLVLRQPATEAEHELLLMSLISQSSVPTQVVEQLPTKLDKNQGVLLLGNNEWLNSQKKLPKAKLYTVANAIEATKPIPVGLKFCDAPALHDARWPDLIRAYEENPVDMPYQRLLAFGGDTWHIAKQYLQEPKLKSIEFQGRTGLIKISQNNIQRVPHCYERSKKGIVAISL